jgi:hypothetical protein
VDCHADTHYAAALDDRGRLLDTAEFTADSTGYDELVGQFEVARVWRRLPSSPGAASVGIQVAV